MNRLSESSKPSSGFEEFSRTLELFSLAGKMPRPSGGWLRLVRIAIRLSAGEVARRMGTSRQLPLQFEKAEAEDSITLRSLRAMAGALGFDLVYALVPKPGKEREIMARLTRSRAVVRSFSRVKRVAAKAL